MRGSTLVAAFLGTVLFATGAGAQSVVVERRGEAAPVAVPGESLTLAFQVANVGGADAVVELTAEGVPTLRTFLQRSRRTLPAGTAELVLVGVRVSGGAPAGHHTVRLRAHGRAGAAEDSVRIEVGARRAIEARVAAAPGAVVAGDAYTVRFEVRNTGNAPERIAARASGDRGVGATPAARTAHLHPGESTMLDFTVDTGPLRQRNLRHQVVLRVAAEGGGEAVAAVARSLVELVPRGAARARAPAAFPLDVRVRASGAAETVGLDVRGGALTGGTGFEFRAHTADPPGAPFARQGEFVLRAASRALEFQAGHGAYGVSEIGALPRYALGGSGAARAGQVRVGGYVAAGRDSAHGFDAFGGFLRAGGDRAGLGVVAEADAAAAAPYGYSAEAWLQPGRLLRAEAEVGIGAEGQGGGPPRRVAVRGAARGFWYDVVHLRPRAEAAGRRRVDAAAASFRPVNAVSLFAAYRRGVDVAPDTAAAPDPVEAGRARIELLRLFHVEARAQRRAGPAGGAAFHGVRMGVAVPIGFLRVEPAVEHGTARGDDGLAGRPYRMRHLRVDARWSGAGVSARVRHEEGAGAVLRDEGGRWTVGVDSWVAVGAGSRVRLSAGGVRADSAARFTGSGNLAVEQRLPGGHTLALRALALREPSREPSVRMQVEYRIPLGVPLPGRRAEGVSVRVLDAGTGRGVEGAVVRVAGRSAITDRSGAAVLDDVPPGLHPVRVERADLGPPWITRSGESPTVRVGPEHAGGIRIEVAEGGTLAGRVDRVPAARGAAHEPLAGVEVRLEGYGMALRAVTRADGSYRFEGLWPGLWRLSFAEESLPRHHEPREASARLHVRPHVNEEANFQILERARAVRIIDGGELSPQP